MRRWFRFLNNRMRKASLKYAHFRHRQIHRHDYLAIDQMIGNFRKSGGLRHQFQFYKLWNLRQLLQKHRPQRILEFGSGSSTMVFGDYVRRNNGAILSIDEDEKWASNTSILLSIKEGDSIEIRVADKVFIFDSTPPEIKYDLKIEDEYDFVFIDGPSLEVDGEKRKDAVNSNIFDLPHHPQIIVVDGRRATMECIAKRYGDLYHTIPTELFTGKSVRLDYSYFSVFVKK